MKLSDQALGALMLSLQKSLLEQTDITEILKSFDFRIDENEQLFVENPPVVKFDFDEDA